METQSFQHLVTELEALTEAQRQAILARLQYLLSHATSQRLCEERQSEHADCPYCHGSYIVRFGFTHQQQRYRCKDCKHTFIALTKTPFQFLRNKEKLLEHAQCMAKSLTIRQSAASTQLTLDRAFRWRHRFLELIDLQQPSHLSGIVEADETFFNLSFKGRRKAFSDAEKAMLREKKRKQVPVLISLQRGSRLACSCQLERRTSTQITQALRTILSADAILSTDGNVSYQQAAEALKIEHGYFVAGISGHGGLSTWHVQNVNAFDSRLKGWMRRFHGVATKYLDHYLGWRRLLDRCKDAMTAEQFLFHALRQEFINT